MIVSQNRISRMSIFPLIQRGDWTFRASISDSKNIMLLAFGPANAFLIRYFQSEDEAKAFVDEVVAGKHVD